MQYIKSYIFELLPLVHFVVHNLFPENKFDMIYYKKIDVIVEKCSVQEQKLYLVYLFTQLLPFIHFMIQKIFLEQSLIPQSFNILINYVILKTDRSYC